MSGYGGDHFYYLDLEGFTKIIFKKIITLSQRNTNLFKVFILLQYSP